MGSSRSCAPGWPPRQWPTSTSPCQGGRAAALGPLGLHQQLEPVQRASQAGEGGDGRRWVLPGLGGVAVHDGWAPYWRYQHITHALCGAHLLRELEGIAEEPGQGWAARMAELLIDVKLVADRAGGAGLHGSTIRKARLRGRYQRLLADGQAANP